MHCEHGKQIMRSVAWNAISVLNIRFDKWNIPVPVDKVAG